jgi:hypothetical protein
MAAGSLVIKKLNGDVLDGNKSSLQRLKHCPCRHNMTILCRCGDTACGTYRC